MAHRCCGGILRKRKLKFTEIDMDDKKEGRKQVGGDHYEKCKIQPKDYIRANGLDFFEGNIVKYITRHKDKEGAKDIRKVIDYAEMILEDVYGVDLRAEHLSKCSKEENPRPEDVYPISNNTQKLKKLGLTQSQIDNLHKDDGANS